MIDAWAREIRFCRDQRGIQRGRELERSFLRGSLRSNRFLANLFVEMYTSCGSLREAIAAFDRIDEPNVYSWTLLMGAFSACGHLLRAREVFERMPERDLVAWNAIIQAYLIEGLIDQARELFDRMPQRNVLSWTSMISGCSATCRVEEARFFFDSMPEWNLITWNSLIAAYAAMGELEEARCLVEKMQEHDVITFTTLLAACARAGKLIDAKCIFNQIPERDCFTWTTLLQANAENGNLQGARKLFNTMPEHNPVSWTSLIHASAHLGEAQEAIDQFSSMNLEGENPDEITLIAVLSACSHIGSIPIIKSRFVSILHDFDLRLRTQHFSCMIDALGRSGWLDSAEELLHSMPFGVVTWTGFIAACRVHKDLIRAKRISEEIMRKFPGDSSSPFVLLSGLYSTETEASRAGQSSGPRAATCAVYNTPCLEWQVGLKS